MRSKLPIVLVLGLIVAAMCAFDKPPVNTSPTPTKSTKGCARGSTARWQSPLGRGLLGLADRPGKHGSQGEEVIKLTKK